MTLYRVDIMYNGVIFDYKYICMNCLKKRGGVPVMNPSTEGTDMKFWVSVAMQSDFEPTIYYFDYCKRSVNQLGICRVDLFKEDGTCIDSFTNCSKWNIRWGVVE
jgi:hypothetical protein